MDAGAMSRHGESGAGALSGHARAVGLAELYDSHHVRMVRLARLLVRSDAEAQELVQDAYVRVHQRWDVIEDPAAYLRQTVVNGCRSHLRRRDLERERRPLAAVPTGIPEIDETWAALARLSPRRRAALVLRFYEDLTMAEVAELLDCREATARSLVHRGLRQLREVLES